MEIADKISELFRYTNMTIRQIRGNFCLLHVSAYIIGRKLISSVP